MEVVVVTGRSLPRETVPQEQLNLHLIIVNNYYCSQCFLALCRYTGSAWIELARGSGSWEIRVKGNLSPRADNGRINSSPTTAVSPVVRLQHGATHTITIPGKEAVIPYNSVLVV